MMMVMMMVKMMLMVVQYGNRRWELGLFCCLYILSSWQTDYKLLAMISLNENKKTDFYFL